MSTKMLAWAFEQELPCAEKFVLVALANLSDDDGNSEPTQTALAAQCGLSRGAVNRLIASLASRGVVTVNMQRSPDGGTRQNRYAISPCHGTVHGGDGDENTAR